MTHGARRVWWVVALVFAGLSLAAQAVAPAAPSNCVATAVSATATNATIKISWNDNSTNEASWVIFCSTNNWGTYDYLGPITSTSMATTGSVSVTWSGATFGQLYSFIVVAYNGSSGPSAESNEASAATYFVNGPTNLSVIQNDPFNVTLRWNENSYPGTGFAIEKKTGTGAWEYLGAIDSNNLSIGPVNWIFPLEACAFRVRAFNGGEPITPNSPSGVNVSPYSNEVQVTGGAYSMTANSVPGQTVINLSWPNIQNETTYRVYFLAADSPPGTQYSWFDTVADVTTYHVTAPAIKAGHTYFFVVAPYNGSNILGESSVANATVDGITSKTGTSGTPGSSFAHTFTHVSVDSVSSRALTGVPSGLVFNSGTGELSGAYPAVGNYTLNYTVNLAGGGTLTQAFSIRVRPVAGAPVVGTLIPVWNGSAGTTRDTALAGTFTDAEAESAVRVSTTLGNMDFILFNTATPATVANFMSYVNAGKYADVDFHRSISNFVIQGGGFKGAGTGSQFTSVVTNAPVTNEPGIANVRGTISMAKTEVGPDSATSQFFVSLGDNRATLDYQNGGFTVFGRVAGAGMAVADAISYLPTGSYNLALDGSATATPFAGFPMNAVSAPTLMDQAQLVKIHSVTTIPTLSYSITGNTSPGVASASIVAGQLHLVGLAGGQTTLTITATDLDNLSTTQTVVANVSDTYTSWAARTTFPGGQSGMAQNPDADAWSNLQEYAFLTDPALPSVTRQVVYQGVAGVAPAARYLTLTLPVRKSTQGLTYAVEAANSLAGAWTEIWKSTSGFAHAQVVSAVDQADRTVVTIKDTAAISGQGKRFMRARVVQE